MGSNGHTLLVGTTDGLFAAEHGANGYSARSLGFEGRGMFRGAVVVDYKDPNVLYAATLKAGAWRSDDRGKSWKEIGNGLIHKEVWSIAQNRKSGRLFLGTSPVFVFTSDDRGEHWTERESIEHLPTTKAWHGPVPPHVARLKDFATPFDDDQLVYGAVEEGWAVRSQDGGETWEQVLDTFQTAHDGHSVAVIPGQNNVVLSATGKGMFRSEDRGDTWAEVNVGLEERSYTSAPFAAHPERPGVLLSAVTAVGPGRWRRPEGGDSGFARSEDGGKTWKVSTAGLPAPCVGIPRGLAIADDNPDLVFTGMMDGTLWKSEDGGLSFERILEGLPPVMTVTALAG